MIIILLLLLCDLNIIIVTSGKELELEEYSDQCMPTT